ncbi:MAG TPA: PVC-type heme-binding CxxCH protein, partial [Gemmataceae bacterium]|nr:PVC-type heme-binding CxxCH protein [Gemmataceae bacterium]
MSRLVFLGLIAISLRATPAAAQMKDIKQMLPPDTYKYAGLTPEKSAEVMTVPPGFSVKLFAGEPDVHQPIAFCIDDRGRLWVVEGYCYPTRRPGKGPFVDAKGTGDKIIIFEDTDGDGKFDKKTVFIEDLNLVSGIELGFGGVWVGAAPYLMFIPIKDGEDKPAGPPKILLDGWGYQDTHETLNSFTWGPDGWLYGCHGVFTHSKVGKPGTPDKERVPMNAGVWRYHPTRHVFEVFAHGTSNPWGLDFNEHGQAFVEACVIPHNWHIIQGGRYHRQAGEHFNPHTYADIQTIAEHRHFVGADPWAGTKTSDTVGGGHAHCGTMIYQGGTWPKEYHGLMFMGNIHGHRINVDKLTPKGSGYVATRAPDFLLANDAWARFINMKYGPDGNVYLIDWYDKQACHDGKVQAWDRSNGRIYKICYKETEKNAKAFVGYNLKQYSDNHMVGWQTNANEWFVRQARRNLQERPHILPIDHEALNKLLTQEKDDKIRLRALWAWYANLGDLPEVGPKGTTTLEVAMKDPSPHMRGWAIRLAAQSNKRSILTAGVLTELAENDLSQEVRRYIASALQQFSLAERWRVLEKLLAHAEDATDHNLPLMYWYA